MLRPRPYIPPKDGGRLTIEGIDGDIYIFNREFCHVSGVSCQSPFCSEDDTRYYVIVEGCNLRQRIEVSQVEYTRIIDDEL